MTAAAALTAALLAAASSPEVGGGLAGLSARLTVVPGADRSPLEAVREVEAALARIALAANPAPAAAAPHAAAAPLVNDLPVVEVPSPHPGRRLAVLLTGDGGWVGIDRALAAAFSDAGVSVVGLDSLRYFWRRRTPEQTARDVARILAHYRAAWERDEVILVGYSRGADIVPIVAGRLPPEERARLVLVAMLGPGTFAELEVHAVDLFTTRRRAGAIPIEDAVRALAGAVPVLCIHGADEHDSLCPHLLDLPWVKDVRRPGGHHFRGAYRELAAQVLEAAR